MWYISRFNIILQELSQDFAFVSFFLCYQNISLEKIRWDVLRSNLQLGSIYTYIYVRISFVVRKILKINVLIYSHQPMYNIVIC